MIGRSDPRAATTRTRSAMATAQPRLSAARCQAGMPRRRSRRRSAAATPPPTADRGPAWAGAARPADRDAAGSCGSLRGPHSGGLRRRPEASGGRVRRTCRQSSRAGAPGRRTPGTPKCRRQERAGEGRTAVAGDHDSLLLSQVERITAGILRRDEQAAERAPGAVEVQAGPTPSMSGGGTAARRRPTSSTCGRDPRVRADGDGAPRPYQRPFGRNAGSQTFPPLAPSTRKSRATVGGVTNPQPSRRVIPASRPSRRGRRVRRPPTRSRARRSSAWTSRARRGPCSP